MNSETFERTFWNYYLELEREYLEIERLIPFDKTNYYTFSYKYIDLLWEICSEIDVLFKEYMEIKEYSSELDENGNPLFNIKQYEKFIEEKLPSFKNQEITCYNPKFHKKKIYPFSLWTTNDSPKWWGIYNKIKHDKELELYGKKAYKCANQICVLNALGALFQLNLYIYEEINWNGLIVPLPESSLFKLEIGENPYKYIINGKDSSEAVNDTIDALTHKLNNL